MKTGIFYASSTGSTERVARTIAKALGVSDADIHNVADTAPSRLGDYDLIVIGSPTYSGSMPPEMEDFLDGAAMLDLEGHTVAVFGDGDETNSDTFCDAVGIIHKLMEKTGATMTGAFNTFPYEFDHSAAVPVEGAGAVGLVLDEMNRPEASETRINAWTAELPH